ncbi:hypothetical protein J6590_018097 [Homalodisca vitripennis]|nr:hypothetical protein J6590_018097 [Homalodisca vitripennis]
MGPFMGTHQTNIRRIQWMGKTTMNSVKQVSETEGESVAVPWWSNTPGASGRRGVMTEPLLDVQLLISKLSNKPPPPPSPAPDSPKPLSLQTMGDLVIKMERRSWHLPQK